MTKEVNKKIVSAIVLKQEGRVNFINDVIEVEKNAWPPELQASKEKFKTRLKVFPKGFFVAIVDGAIKGVTTSQIINYPFSAHKWDEITDSGFIKNSHIPTGNALYIVSLGIAKDAQGMGLGKALIEAQKGLAKKLNLQYVVLGARIPNYDRYCHEHGEISIEKYLKLANEKLEPLDPEIRFYERQGLKLQAIKPGFEADNESRDFGAVMVWEVEK